MNDRVQTWISRTLILHCHTRVKAGRSLFRDTVMPQLPGREHDDAQLMSIKDERLIEVMLGLHKQVSLTSTRTGTIILWSYTNLLNVQLGAS